MIRAILVIGLAASAIEQDQKPTGASVAQRWADLQKRDAAADAACADCKGDGKIKHVAPTNVARRWTTRCDKCGGVGKFRDWEKYVAVYADAISLKRDADQLPKADEKKLDKLIDEHLNTIKGNVGRFVDQQSNAIEPLNTHARQVVLDKDDPKGKHLAFAAVVDDLAEIGGRRLAKVNLRFGSVRRPSRLWVYVEIPDGKRWVAEMSVLVIGKVVGSVTNKYGEQIEEFLRIAPLAGTE